MNCTNSVGVIINNKNMKKILLGLGTLALVFGIMGTFTNTVEAYRGDPAVKGPNYTVERHDAMQKAFETKDYTAWVNLMKGKGRVTQVINESNFAKFAEAHLLAQQGKTAEAKTIMKDLGLRLNNGLGCGFGRGMNR